MIEIAINEATDSYPIKRIHFSDSTGNCFRTSYFNKDGKFIFERIEEIQLSSDRVQSTCLFVGENYELLAYREYFRSESNKGTKDYRLIDGEYQQINSSIYEVSDDPYYSKMIWNNSTGELCYYNESNRNGSEFYDSSGQIIENLDEYLASIKFDSIELITSELLAY
ncbi:hypothetical protein [Acinetobacter modestus]|uniref:hypothetical protein n=1 Tax=Acinetobacter modestus TaxID=1776740 RepID=UPI001F4A9AC4|nr:hypothetical protein [Acinetobacter modestus]MCH7330233.1 hypothetical protein [Acinetobacter modestus]